MPNDFGSKDTRRNARVHRIIFSIDNAPRTQNKESIMKSIACVVLLLAIISCCSPKLAIRSGYFVDGQELTEQGMMDFTAELADRKGEGRWEKTEQGWEWYEKQSE